MNSSISIEEGLKNIERDGKMIKYELTIFREEDGKLTIEKYEKFRDEVRESVANDETGIYIQEQITKMFKRFPKARSIEVKILE